MGVIFVSPSERPPISNLGETSALPESMGADILLIGKYGMFGIQRKEVADLAASLRGDRVATGLGKMRQLQYGAWIVEGKWNWTNDGHSLNVRGYTRAEYQGVLFSLHWHGYWVIETESAAHTCDVIGHLNTWLDKNEHTSLHTRPKPQTQWGRVDDRDWGIFLLQSIEGIGVSQAATIWDYFGGLPLQWTVERARWKAIRGIGPKRIDALYRAIKGAEDVG